jgi:CspA family cold shock protein
MKQGTVLWFKDEKGYGFLRPDGEGKDLFVHYSAINNGGKGRRSLVKDQRVEFEVVQTDKGPAAANVTVIR